MKLRYGDQNWSSLPNIDFIHTGPNKETGTETYYEKHLQYEFGISSGSGALTTFPAT